MLAPCTRVRLRFVGLLCASCVQGIVTGAALRCCCRCLPDAAAAQALQSAMRLLSLQAHHGSWLVLLQGAHPGAPVALWGSGGAPPRFAVPGCSQLSILRSRLLLLDRAALLISHSTEQLKSTLLRLGSSSLEQKQWTPRNKSAFCCRSSRRVKEQPAESCKTPSPHNLLGCRERKKWTRWTRKSPTTAACTLPHR